MRGFNIKKKKFITLKCDQCHIEYQLNMSTYRDRLRNNRPNLCKDCMKIYSSEKLSNYMKEYNKTHKMTKEERIIHSEKIKQGMANMSEESKNHMRKNQSKGQIKRRKNMTPEKKAELDRLILNGIHNMSNDAKEQHRINVGLAKIKEWEELPNEVRIARINRLENDRQNYYDNLTEDGWRIFSDKVKEGQHNMSKEAREQMLKNNSNSNKRYWANLSYKDYIKREIKRQEGFQNYFDNLSNYINKNEQAFIDILIEYNIYYQIHWKNKIIHDNFNFLFPINPITKSRFVSPYHVWDFHIITKFGNEILIDIDGSIHDPLQTDYNVTLENGLIVKLKDLIEFNDSKRFYQRDNIPAYIIQCYNDDLSLNSKVINIQNNDEIILKEFIKKIL